jgi:N-acetylmuramoyl-L-alanine amidase
MSCPKWEKWRGGRWPRPLVRIGAAPILAGVCLAAACSIVPVVGFARAPVSNSSGAAKQLRPTAAAEAAGAAPSARADADSPPPMEERQSTPVASAVHTESSGDEVRLVFDLSAAVPATAFVLADPKRVIVDLPEVDFEIAPQVGLPAKPARRRAGRKTKPAPGLGPAALIAAYRFGLFAPGRSRIVIDLAAPARIEQAASEAAAGQGQRLVIELVRTDEASFAAAAQAAQAAQPAATAAPPQATPQDAHDADVKPIVVIDPGHGGIDTGAVGGPGIVEKQIVFDFAMELAAKLEAGGRYKIVMTRTSDVFVPLGERVHMARDSNAALFISIHADDLLDAPASVSGATVYTASDRASDAEAARVAESENRADAVGGVDRKDDPSDVSDILLDLTRRETRAYSNVFARTLVNYWKVAARLNKNPHRSAGFVVLEAPDVPSVLLELGYLSSRKDAAELLSPEWRAKATDSVVQSIDEFFAQRQAHVQSTKADAGAIATEPAGAAVSQH